MSNRLGGKQGTAYTGTNANQPPNWTFNTRNPTQFDINYSLGDLWMNTVNEEIFVLVSLAGTVNSKGELATWIQWGGAGNIETLTGDTGGPVFPDSADNINTLGTAGQIHVAGNPGTHTLTWSLDGSVATSYPTDAGTAIPSGNILNIISDIAVTNCGATVEFTGVGNTVTLHVSDSFANTMIGINAGNNTFNHSVATFNTGIGATALQALTTGVQNTAVGGQSLPAITSGTANCAFGAFSVRACTTGDHNNGYGDQSLTALVSGINNCGLGSNTFSKITTGNNNTGVGTNAGFNNTGADSFNLCINDDGYAGESNTIRICGRTPATARDNIFIGNATANQGYTIGTAVLNIGIGSASLSQITTANQNTCVGSSSGAVMTTGVGNTLIGAACGDAITTGGSNTAVGLVSLSAMVSGSSNTAIGVGSHDHATSGSGNTSLGFDAAGSLLTGSNNIAIGNGGGGAWTGAESDNICIGTTSGAIGDNNILRIGSATGGATGQLNKAFISGIRGITTGNADAVAVLVDSANQLGTISSSIRYKENVNDMGSSSDDLMKLRPVTFNYKNDESKRQMFGLIAEEVKETFPYLAVHNADGEVESVKYHELAVILLNEVQKLAKRIEILEAYIYRS